MTGHQVEDAPAEGVEFSFTISCYNEQDSIDEFHRRLTDTLQEFGRSFEIIYVNDGSSDATFERLRAIYAETPEVSAIIDLFRNVGQVNAVTAALARVRGRNVVFLDSDLQLDPEDFPRLAAEFEKGYDMVSGKRKKRRDSYARRLASIGANFIIRWLIPHTPSDYGCTFKIFDAKLVRAHEYGPISPFRPSDLMDSVERCSETLVNHHPRRYNASGWKWTKLLAFTMDNLLGISPRPFQALALLFLLAAGGLFIGIAALLMLGLAGEQTPVTSVYILLVLLVNLFLTAGLLMGISEFVIRNHTILRRRPAYIIREEYSRHSCL